MARNSPIAYYGAKNKMVKHILPLIPSHNIYIEPFFGSGCIFFQKGLAKSNVINDFDDRVINFWRQYQTNLPALEKELSATLYSSAEWQRAHAIFSGKVEADPLIKAWAFVVNFAFSVFYNGSSFRISTCNDNTYWWHCFKESFPFLFSKLKNATILNWDVLKVIKTQDTDDSFFYLDPPYIGTSNGHYGHYKEDNYKELLDALKSIKGKFLLSSYPNEFLANAVAEMGWNYIEVKMKGSAGTYNKKGVLNVIEVLCFNYDRPIQTLF